MKIFKYLDWINESSDKNNSVDELIKLNIYKIKKKVDKLFDKADTDNKENFNLESSEINHSYNFYSLTVKFLAGQDAYTIIFNIPVESVIEDGENQDLKKCYIKMKVYNEFDDLVGQIPDTENWKEIEIEDIKEDFIENLIIEFNEIWGDDEDEFKIEI
jgi:hypothetical protein